MLRTQGFRVVRRLAYEIVKLPSLPGVAITALGGGDVVFAMFFSTESADHVVNLIRAAGLGETVRNVEAVAISERPIMALKRLPWRRISVAAKPNQDAMLALLQ
jgi:uroporphyrinogen-III synthase